MEHRFWDFRIRDGCLERYKGDSSLVYVPPGVSAIGRSAFKGNGRIKEVRLPEGVETIE